MPPDFVRPFHFWCQKVLPLVFDDSLSYYEVLAKMRDCLNTAIQEINAIGNEFDGVKTQLTELKTYVDEYFAGLDVNQAISDKLDDMVESGEMDAVITPIFAAYANPLFAASVADMIATNFAYANYENNKIYVFNQSTGLYQTTGKEFGGVVPFVNEMEDNDKYYALDSDGMLYNYDFPQSAFVATGLTYGGYRYGVNSMRPIANVYVLTTDSHVYTWNGNEYVDTGVVYGLSNTAFVWRRKLSSADNITLLITDGWYYFENDDLPMGLPVNMETSDGFAIVYSIAINTVDNKRIVLHTDKGGSWFWNGLTWIDENEIGFPVCDDCNNVNWNSVLTCDNNTFNTPENKSGLLKTFYNETKSQLFFDNNHLWFRINNNQWVRTVEDKEQELNNANIAILYGGIDNLTMRVAILSSFINSQFNTINANIKQIKNVLMTTYDAELCDENGDFITSENEISINASVYVQRTDKTLTQPNIAADGEAVGNKFTELNADIANANTEIDKTKAKLTKAISDERTYTEHLLLQVFEINCFPTLTEDNSLICCEDGAFIFCEMLTQKTDATLTEENVPADANAVGETFNELIPPLQSKMSEASAEILQLKENQNATIPILTTLSQYSIADYTGRDITTNEGDSVTGAILTQKTDKTLTIENVAADAKITGDYINAQNANNFLTIKEYVSTEHLPNMLGVSADYHIPFINLIGELPLTKNNIPVVCESPFYTGYCNIKVQGSSSLKNSEKNYTITFPNNVAVFNFNTNEYNLKCNYIDPSQIRNIVCARLWSKIIDCLYPTTLYETITTENAKSIICENDDNLLAHTKQTQIQRSPNNGVSDGELCCVFHNGDFHGVYTLQLPKGNYMLGMHSSNQFAIEVEWWNATPVNASTFDDHFSLLCKSNNLTDESIINKVATFTQTINETDTNFYDTISAVTNPDLWLAYLCFCMFTYHYDGIFKNYLLYSFDGGKTINPTVWDMDATFYNTWTSNTFWSCNSLNTRTFEQQFFNKLKSLETQRLKTMWNTLHEQVLNHETVSDLCNEMLLKFNNNLFRLDFIKWHEKGKTNPCFSDLPEYALISEKHCQSYFDSL